MDLGLKGKRAIVTGGSLGIGKAIARELAREGADVAIAARSKDTLETAARELATETGRRIIPLMLINNQEFVVHTLQIRMFLQGVS